MLNSELLEAGAVVGKVTGKMINISNIIIIKLYIW